MNGDRLAAAGIRNRQDSLLRLVKGRKYPYCHALDDSMGGVGTI